MIFYSKEDEVAGKGRYINFFIDSTPNHQYFDLMCKSTLRFKIKDLPNPISNLICEYLQPTCHICYRRYRIYLHFLLLQNIEVDFLEKELDYILRMEIHKIGKHQDFIVEKKKLGF